MTLYERTGVPAAYIDRDGEHIYLFDGSPAAYIHGDAVYGFDGTQYGWFEKGWVRDLDGLCVFLRRKPGLEARPSRPDMRLRPNGPGKPGQSGVPGKPGMPRQPIRRHGPG